MRISDWSSDVCSSDLHVQKPGMRMLRRTCRGASAGRYRPSRGGERESRWPEGPRRRSLQGCHTILIGGYTVRSEEHTSELQSLMRISYAVFCLKKQKPVAKQHLQDDHAKDIY